MKNETEPNGKILFNIHVKHAKIVNDQDSNMQSVSAVYGMIFAREYSDKLKYTNILIYVDEYASIGIVDMDTGEEILHWEEKIVLGRESSILLYVLADDFEWLIYKSQEADCGFCLATIPKKHPAHDGIIKKTAVLGQFQAYKAMADLLVGSNFKKHLSGYSFGYDESVEEINTLWHET